MSVAIHTIRRTQPPPSLFIEQWNGDETVDLFCAEISSEKPDDLVALSADIQKELRSGYMSTTIIWLSTSSSASPSHSQLQQALSNISTFAVIRCLPPAAYLAADVSLLRADVSSYVSAHRTGDALLKHLLMKEVIWASLNSQRSNATETSRQLVDQAMQVVEEKADRFMIGSLWSREGERITCHVRTDQLEEGLQYVVNSVVGDTLRRCGLEEPGVHDASTSMEVILVQNAASWNILRRLRKHPFTYYILLFDQGDDGSKLLNRLRRELLGVRKDDPPLFELNMLTSEEMVVAALECGLRNAKQSYRTTQITKHPMHLEIQDHSIAQIDSQVEEDLKAIRSIKAGQDKQT
jgi:hypothetical protein